MDCDVNRKASDVFVASVINQKAVNQNAQQILVAFAVQHLDIYEAQFGFAENEEEKEIKRQCRC